MIGIGPKFRPPACLDPRPRHLPLEWVECRECLFRDREVGSMGSGWGHHSCSLSDDAGKPPAGDVWIPNGEFLF